MAKMFYTLEEVAQKLGKSEDDVKQMASSGEIQEFRDRDKLMFKVDQIDLLAGDEDTGDVHLELEDTSGGSGIGLSSSSLAMSDSREGTGISVFDTDHGGEDDADRTHVADAMEDDLSLEAVGSGSGLLDLTRESDDTSLGAELLEEVYSGDDNIEIPANASGLFEAAGTDMRDEAMAASGIASMPMVVEVYDGGGSGLGVGLMIGALISIVLLMLIVFVGVAGATPGLAMTIADQLWIWLGGLFGGTIILGLVGMFIGKSSE